MAASKPEIFFVLESSQEKTSEVLVPPVTSFFACFTEAAQGEAATTSSAATGPELMALS